MGWVHLVESTPVDVDDRGLLWIWMVWAFFVNVYAGLWILVEKLMDMGLGFYNVLLVVSRVNEIYLVGIWLFEG